MYNTIQLCICSLPLIGYYACTSAVFTEMVWPRDYSIIELGNLGLRVRIQVRELIKRSSPFSSVSERWTPCLVFRETLGTSQVLATGLRTLKTGDVAQRLVRRNSNPKTLGSIPWRGSVSDRFFCVPPINSCADLFVPDSPPPSPPSPPSCVRYAPKFVCTLNNPYPSVVNE